MGERELPMQNITIVPIGAWIEIRIGDKMIARVVSMNAIAKAVAKLGL